MKALGRIIKQIVCILSTQMDCIHITTNTTFCCSFVCQRVSKLKTFRTLTVDFLKLLFTQET